MHNRKLTEDEEKFYDLWQVDPKDYPLWEEFTINIKKAIEEKNYHKIICYYQNKFGLTEDRYSISAHFRDPKKTKFLFQFRLNEGNQDKYGLEVDYSRDAEITGKEEQEIKKETELQELELLKLKKEYLAWNQRNITKLFKFLLLEKANNNEINQEILHDCKVFYSTLILKLIYPFLKERRTTLTLAEEGVNESYELEIKSIVEREILEKDLSVKRDRYKKELAFAFLPTQSLEFFELNIINKFKNNHLFQAWRAKDIISLLEQMYHENKLTFADINHHVAIKYHRLCNEVIMHLQKEISPESHEILFSNLLILLQNREKETAEVIIRTAMVIKDLSDQYQILKLKKDKLVDALEGDKKLDAQIKVIVSCLNYLFGVLSLENLINIEDNCFFNYISHNNVFVDREIEDLYHKTHTLVPEINNPHDKFIFFNVKSASLNLPNLANTNFDKGRLKEYIDAAKQCIEHINKSTKLFSSSNWWYLPAVKKEFELIANLIKEREFLIDQCSGMHKGKLAAIDAALLYLFGLQDREFLLQVERENYQSIIKKKVFQHIYSSTRWLMHKTKRVDVNSSSHKKMILSLQANIKQYNHNDIKFEN